MIYVTAQPDLPYFHWQVKVYIHNFIKKGISPKDIHVIFKSEKPSSEALEATKEVNVYFYNDDRLDKSYIPSIKPYLISRWLRDNPQYGKCFYLHDSDIIFREVPDYTDLLSNDICYMADTKSYISYDYLEKVCIKYEEKFPESKHLQLLTEMADIVKIPILSIKENNDNSGGAQYIIKNTDWKLWKKIYEDCTPLYKQMKDYDKRFPIEDGKIQFWTAEMWSILWNLWKAGKKTAISDKLSFSWATSDIATYDKHPVLHMSGVTELTKSDKFYKGEYINRNPIEEYRYNNNLFDYINKDSATIHYINEIKELSKMNKNNVEKIFTDIYNDNLWMSGESKSGSGSELKNTEVLRSELPFLFKKYNITSILDIPCGDMNWMSKVDMAGITYIGGDIVQQLINDNIAKFGLDFRHLDIINSTLPKVDLVFVRDCLGHLSTENIKKALINIKRSGSKYLLTTCFTKYTSNTDIKDGGWKCINLMVEPFKMRPIYLINEDCREGYPHFQDKSMVLFNIEEITL